MEEVSADYILKQYVDNFDKFAVDCLKIQTLDMQLVPFRFHVVQQIMQEIIANIESSGRLKRMVVLKARREGMSTYFLGRYYHKCSLNFNRYATIITHEPEASDTLFGITRRYQVHNELRPMEKYNNRREINFNTKDGKGLDSSIRVATAGKEDVGSGQLIHYLHLSEVAKWPAHTTEALLTSVIQCVPNHPETEIVFESTAKGVGGQFYDRYWASRYMYEIYLSDGKPKWRVVINDKAQEANEFSAVFVPWFVFDKYQMSPPQGFVPTEKEEELAKLYGLTDNHLTWRRWCIANNCGGDEAIFRQEYPSNAREAFLSSGSAVFNSEQLDALLKEAPDPIKRYDIIETTGQFIADDNGEFKVWEEPKPGEGYIVAIDVSEGLEKGDYSCIQVIHQLSGRQVAEWHGKRDPDILARLAYAVGMRYNYAWACPERNNHGLMTVNTLLNMGYPKMWVDEVPEQIGKKRQRYGWMTSRTSKPVIIDNLIFLMRESPEIIRSALLLDEMLTFKRNEKGEFGAEEGRFDDCVMAMAIAQYTRSRLPTPAQVPEIAVIGKTSYPMDVGNDQPSALAWS